LLPLGPGARGVLAVGVVAVGVILDLAGLFLLHAQQPATGMNPNEPAATAVNPQARLHAQRLKTRNAKVAYEVARLNCEVAELALKGYTEGIYARDLAAVEVEIELAMSALRRAEDRLRWQQRMRKRGYLLLINDCSDYLSYEKAKFALEQARSQRDLLVKYIREKTTKELEREVKKARADELDKKAAWKHEEANEADLEREIGRLNLTDRSDVFRERSRLERSPS
jgi:hypothetical protein